MPNILITGAASGLGRAFLIHYAQYLFTQTRESKSHSGKSESASESHIYALDRTDDFLETLIPDITDPKLHEWMTSHVHILPAVDITNAANIANFTAQVRDLDLELDLVIHSAGIRGLVGNGRSVQNYGDVRRSEDVRVMNAETLRGAFDVNVVGAFEVLRACVPALKRRAGQTGRRGEEVGKKKEQEEQRVPKVIVMGSRMGSISHNTAGNDNAGAAYAYRASKAALNAVVRSFSVDVPEVVWVVVHPGRVQTALVQVKEDGAMTVEESVGDVANLVERLRREDSGRFVDRFGVDIPW